MKISLRLAIAPLVAALVLPSIAHAEAAAASDVRAGRMIRTADGKRLGAIDKINRDASGAAQSVSVIYNGAFVSIPAETLSGSGAVYVTSLSMADVRKQR